jgi:AcrR family transcriptional regulator
MTVRAKPGPRDRLLRAAKELTYAQGLTVGVDALLKEADVARRSLYEHFGGKDGLLAEVIRTSAAEDEQWYRSALAQGGDDPRARILALFDALDVLVRAPDFRGCRYLAADLALSDADNPVHAETRAHRKRLHRMLRQQLAELGHPNPTLGATQLRLLIEALLVAGATRESAHPGRALRGLVESVVSAA